MSWRSCSWLNSLSKLRSSMPSRRNALKGAVAAALLPAMLAGCGFEPIAASTSAIGEKDLVLAQVNVQSSDSRFAYRLKKEILRSVAIDSNATQAFTVSTAITRAGLAIEQNDTVTRRNVTADTSYALASTDRVAGEHQASVISGDTSVTTAVNTTASQYSASVSEREAIERLAKETARRLLTFLRVNRQ